MKPGSMILAVVIIALLAFVAWFGWSEGMFSLGGDGTKVTVSMDGHTIESAAESDIEWCDAQFYIDGEMVDNFRMSIRSSQTFYVDGVAGAGALSISLSAQGLSAMTIPGPSDSSVEEGQDIRIIFANGESPYWTVS